MTSKGQIPFDRLRSADPGARAANVVADGGRTAPRPE